MQKSNISEKIMAIQVLNAQRLIRLRKENPTEFKQMQFVQAFEPLMWSKDDIKSVKNILKKYPTKSPKNLKVMTTQIVDDQSTCSSSDDEDVYSPL